MPLLEKRPEVSGLNGSNIFEKEQNTLAELGLGYRGYFVLLSAVKLNLFQYIEDSDGTIQNIVKRSGTSLHHTEVLLNALASLGFLSKKGSLFSNTTFGRESLIPGGKNSIVNNLRYQALLSDAYVNLAETIRNGKPARDLMGLLKEDPKFIDSYILGMAEIARNPAQSLAKSLDLTGVSRVLDVGGGPGLFTLAILDRAPEIEATIFDLPETLRYTERFVNDSPHQKNIRLMAGDYHRDVFGGGPYDLVLMSHVTHDESFSSNQAIIQKAYDALKSGGRLVIHDFVLNSDNKTPLFSVLFGVQMMTYTNQGRCFSVDDYLSLLKTTKFLLPEIYSVCPSIPNSTTAIISKKAGVADGK